ncbi:T9SS type B sorting domain-containing protein [Confluentibacter sediminis]|uniref:T9SS type B sorting domain-containing protein n=1 Tax=Confluentibacter sediminis TaxID=2219045 RepID=UPI000DABCC09|nr:T9SS type B sorting domain-containing protein [Confluentibacter sediminis]
MNIKTLITLTLTTLTCFVSASQDTFVPDDNFEQALIDLGYDSGPLNDFVPTANISGITNLDIPNANISDLTGIEDFTSLTQLDCSGNLLTSIDVSALSSLKILWCFSNQLIHLDVSQNTQLISLVCNNNFLSNLDVTTNINLTVLVFKNNTISVIDVTKNTSLIRLECGNNLIPNINLTKSPDLSIFTCENNQLSTLDLRYNTNLNTLNCSFNQLSELDISNNPGLLTIDCSNNNLCKLNLKNGNNLNADVNFGFNLNLNCVVVDSPTENHTGWNPTNFSNYVSSQNDCSNFVNVDTLANVVTNSSYTLPAITYGNYYTESEANGMPLFSGDRITSSQTIYIYNESLCASNESHFYVLITDEDYYIPKYFTPNNDGNHDVWNVQDFTNAIKDIRVFDRYGKLLKSFASHSEGWNGMYRGRLLENDDYWYAITLNSGGILKGHFTLKR